MRKPQLSPHQQAIWNTLTKEQQDVITIFAVNYYETNEPENFDEVLDINDVDAATYTTQEQYIVWRSITAHQKLVVKECYKQMLELNEPDLILKYDDNEVYNLAFDFDVFVLYNTFTTMNDMTFRPFRFFNNQND
jgi:hypothetical protein